MCGGAMGGVTGPGRALYVELVASMATEGRAAMAVDYRKAGDLSLSFLDTCAAADLAMRNGAKRFVGLSHSFGGAVAVQEAGTFPHLVAGVITYATQSGGCEEATRMGDTPLLLLHGEHDSILGPENSMMVQALAGHGDIRTFPKTDHLMSRDGRRDRRDHRRMGAGPFRRARRALAGCSIAEFGIEQFLQTGLDPSQSGGGVA